MKKYSTYLALSLLLLTTVNYTAKSQKILGNLLKKVTNKSSTTNPSSTEITQGLKQALEIGTNAGVDLLSAKDGFLGNAAVKILFPPEAQKVEKTLRSLGLNALADNVVLTLNRAAEDAVKQAKPIFVNAIKQMSIADATNILLGSKDAATQYFQKVTTSQLTEKFKPVITTSLDKVGCTKYWADAAKAYNKLPLVNPVNADLSSYVTQKAIEGMFVQVAQQELKIRDNLGARTSPLLQKVFGFADGKK